ncbi:MAG TPA: Abi-alpha family protein [Mycobacteriales bacterium]|nr:Abi-alpha family protein [Mycobacteriales bacterium]
MTPDGPPQPAVVEVRRTDAHPSSALQAVPGLVRLGVTAWARTASWGLAASLAASNRVLRAAVSGESPSTFLAAVGDELRNAARELLGVVDLPELPGATVIDRIIPVTPEPVPEPPLHAQGAELLRRSADLSVDDELHPAYSRILSELAPDEARVLRLLALDGAQPAVDVRTSRPLNVGSELVAPGLSMIGAQAGCRHLDRVPAYLNNLYRLGLIWFSREPVTDRTRYQVLEAQPDVAAALKQAGRGRTVRRSILLTPFGADFCAVCFPPPELPET